MKYWMFPVCVAVQMGCSHSGSRSWTSEMAISPDFRLACSALARGGPDVEEATLSLWDNQTGELLWSRRAAKDTTQTAMFIGKGDTLEIDTYTPRTKTSESDVADARTGNKSRTFPTLSPLSMGHVLTPDGKLIVSGNSDGTFQIVDLETGKERATIQAHRNAIKFFTLSHDGTLLASCAKGEEPKIWKIPSGETVRSIVGERDRSISRLAFTPDGTLLAVTGPPKEPGARSVVTFWDVGTGSLARSMEACAEVIVWMAFSPDGSQLAVHCTHPKPRFHLARLYDVSTGKELPTMFQVRWSETALCRPSLLAFWIAFTPEGRCVILGRKNDDPQDLVLWDLHSGEELRRFAKPRETP